MRTTLCSVVNSEPEAMSYDAKPTKVLGSLPNEDGIELGCGNVFADLGFRNAEKRLLKAELATKIAQLFERRGWPQAQSEERTAWTNQEECRVYFVVSSPAFSSSFVCSTY